jgi:hypothetical protein
MNGIIFHGTEIHYGGIAEFLFSPEIGYNAMPAIIEFLGGEKAYAEIIHALPSEITITVGEHSTNKEEKVPQETWLLRYDKKEDNWKIIEKLQPG